MTRTVAIALFCSLAVASAHAQSGQRAAAPKTGGQLRAECYRELGYTREQAQKPSQVVVQQVNECVARKQAGGR